MEKLRKIDKICAKVACMLYGCSVQAKKYI